MALFSRKPAPAVLSAPAGPAGKRAYVIGDVHGCADALETVLAIVERDVAESGKAECSLVFLGDLVDRGPDSRRVVERVMRLCEPGAALGKGEPHGKDAARGWGWAHGQAICLMGNHEDTLLRAWRGDGRVMGDWLRFGADATLRSYGIDVPERKPGQKRPDRKRLLELMRRAVPRNHVDFLSGLPLMVRFGNFLCVHAGIDPARKIAVQRDEDLLWIRDPFLSARSFRDRGVCVVHGHTVTDRARLHTARIGIDTGVYRTGRLSVLRIQGTDLRVASSAAGEGKFRAVEIAVRDAAPENGALEGAEESEQWHRA